MNSVETFCMFCPFEFHEVLIGIITFILVWSCIRRPTRYPPGPRGVPILGVLPFLSKYPEREFLVWSKRYGSLLSVPIAWQRWIVLNDYDVTMEVLVKNRMIFHMRPAIRFFQEALDPLGIAFSPGGAIWKAHRSFGTRAIRAIGQERMEERITTEIDYFIAELEKHNRKSFDIQDTLTHSIANVICGFTLGERFDYKDVRFEKLVGCIIHIGEVVKDWKTMFLTLLSPLAHIWPFTRHVDEFKNTMKTFNDLIREIVEEQQSSFNGIEVRNMIDAYLLKSQSFVSCNEKYTIEDIVGFFSDMFIAGTETLASQLRWGFLIMMLNPECQENVRSEIHAAIGGKGRARLSDRYRMPYTCAVIQEIFRFRTLTALSLPRMNVVDVEIEGCKIPKGSKVILNTWAIHNDERNWENPQKFIPERHLDKDGNFINSKKVLPFSVGARSCLGEQLARAEIFLFFVATLQNFKLKLDPNAQVPSLDDASNGTIFSPNPYTMIAERINEDGINNNNNSKVI
ncbi:vitamin D 25-hydroxylase-like [Ciona intestinalis]